MLKNNLEYSLRYEKRKSSDEKYPVIIVAAGSASRMKGIDKMLCEINGKSVIAHTVAAFAESSRISEIVVVTRKEKIDELKDILKASALDKPLLVIEGGACREESVLCGIKALGCEYKKVLIHDGARPIISLSVIERVCDALSHADSVACAVKIKDTVKVVNEDMQVAKTLNRDALVSIQTPQGVSVELFCESADKFDLSRFTDDTSVVEAVGARTQIVEGDYKNIKITTPEDIKLAEIYIGNQEN